MSARRGWLGPLLVLVLGAAAVVAVWVLLSRPAPPRETVAAVDAVRAVEQAWPSVASVALPEALTRVTIVDDGGAVLAARGEPFRGDADAYAAGAGAFAVEVEGVRVGTLYALDRSESLRREAAIAASWAAAAGIGAVVAAAWLLALRQYRTVVQPFRRLETFAADVAQGDLDTPLPMDRTNTFGAFSEAFDLMRTELASSRAREEAANENARKLVAELSHDIRTPVASIAATAEVVTVKTTDPTARDAAEVILGKTAQIESLVADLVQANEVAIESLPVNIEEHSSADLGSLIRSCDAAGSLRTADLPECLVAYDPLRMRQVVDNVLVNAAKYAGTEVDLGGAISEDFLVLRFRDRGPGVLDEELDAILGRRVRGSNVGDAPGEGLGLFSASVLMARMGGTLSCRNARPGLAVIVEIPLAR